MPRLEYLMTYRADLKEPVEIGAVPSGSRQIYDVTGGSFEGPRLKGKLLASGWTSTASKSVRASDRGTICSRSNSQRRSYANEPSSGGLRRP